MSNSIWKTPDQKPDVFKPYTIMVVYEAHDEAELMLSTQYEAYTADRYINRWCYLDELLAQTDKAERLQKAVDNSREKLAAFMHDVWGNWFAHQLNNSTVENLQRWGYNQIHHIRH